MLYTTTALPRSANERQLMDGNGEKHDDREGGYRFQVGSFPRHRIRHRDMVSTACVLDAPETTRFNAGGP